MRKVMRNMDLGAELGAKIYVFWGGREGSEVDVAKDVTSALDRYREAIDTLAQYSNSSRRDDEPPARGGHSARPRAGRPSARRDGRHRDPTAARVPVRLHRLRSHPAGERRA